MLIVVLALALPFAGQDLSERHVRATERPILPPTILRSSRSATVLPALRPVTLLVSNLAEVPPAVMSQARSDVLRVYSQIGLTLTLEDDDLTDNRTVSRSPEQMLLRIRILQDGPRRQRGARALGAAPRSPEEARVACVYYAHVEQRARRDGVEPALVLGYAIAHEVGHLLLPAYEHPAGGLMKAVFDRDDLTLAAQGQLRFSKEEAALMHAVVPSVASLTIVVHVLNDSDVSDKDLLLAQLQAARTYQAIGITMRWITGGADTDTYPPGVFHVRLHLLSGDRANRMASTSNLNSDVLGLAVSPARLVYVWCDRIRWSVTPRLGNLAGVLGRVIAHELGHVLLPSRAALRHRNHAREHVGSRRQSAILYRRAGLSHPRVRRCWFPGRRVAVVRCRLADQRMYVLMIGAGRSVNRREIRCQP
jgi:hypothetical protein